LKYFYGPQFYDVTFNNPLPGRL